METIKKDNSGTLSLPENLEKLLTDCTLCQRNCHVNRMAGQIGYCLQTGTLRAAKREGLRIPIVYNTSSYEKVSTLQLLDGLVDIYLPDLKYESAALSGLLSNAPDYFETATAAIAEMVRQVGEPVFAAPDGTLLLAAQMNDACEEADEDAEFLMKKGVIVRHLALPGQEADSKRVLSYLLKTYGERIYISLMNQYTPISSVLEKTLPKLTQSACLTGLQRRLTEDEYEALIDFAIENGIENGFIQDQETAQESFIPAFDGEGI